MPAFYANLRPITMLSYVMLLCYVIYLFTYILKNRNRKQAHQQLLICL